MKQHLEALNGQEREPGFIAQLMTLVPVFTQASGIQLEQLRFDAKQGEFRLVASASTAIRISIVSASWPTRCSRSSRGI